MADRLRVLHVIESLNPALGGPAVILPAMADALARTGEVEVTVYAIADGEPPLDPRATYERASFGADRPDLLRSRAFSSALARALWRDVPRFSLVHSHGVFTNAVVLANEICRLRGVPFVMRSCGALTRYSLSQGSGLKRPFLFALTRPELRAASFVHCTSTEEAEDLSAVEPRARTEVIPHGIDTEAYAKASPAAARARYGRYVLFLGRMHAIKRLDLLVEAFAVLGSRHPDLRLVLAGPDGGVQRDLESAVGRHGMADRVFFTGLVTGDEKRELLRGAAAFSLASQHENFGISILEACAAGCPVVVSDRVALAGEVAALRAGEVVSLDVASLAAGLTRVLADRAAYETGSRRLADTLSWQASAGKLVAAYRRAIADHAGRRGRSVRTPRRGVDS